MEKNSEIENLLDIDLDFKMTFDDSFLLEEIALWRDICWDSFDVIEDDLPSNGCEDIDEKSDFDDNKIDTFSEK